mmetsp:Transcript_39003/g.70250  ORF Transcript_39003/g.70250 Transcript_39003/m.70250 type:complete len:1144 (+) Transcript_39003:1488-4919(+)
MSSAIKAMARLNQRRLISRQDTTKSDDSFSDENSEVSENAGLTPKDAFHKFDTDASGDIDEDEFFHLLQSVGIKGNEEYQERLFRRYVKSGSKTIDYDGFKTAWILLGQPKQELLERGVKGIPKFATRYQLVRLLEKTLDDEERLDALAKAEADRYQRLQDRKKLRTEYIQKAKARAGLELGAALDAAGQVYVLGKGAHGQFSGTPKPEMSTSSFHQIGFELMQTLWEERVEAMVAKSQIEHSSHHGANSNTAGVWGRQPRKVVLTDNTILALTDNGLLSWGGSSNWHSVSNSQPMQKASCQLTQTTPRSSALLMNNDRMHRKHMAIIQEEMNEKDTKSACEVGKLELVLKYYGRGPLHFDGTNDVDMVRDHLLASISHDQILHSLILRGKPCEGNGFSMLEIADILATDIALEKEILGEGGQQELCDIEWEILDLKKRRKTKSARFLALSFAEKWAPLGKEQKQRATAEEQRKEAERRSNHSKQDNDYEKWNRHRKDMESVSILENHGGLMSGSITTRGNDVQTPRGVSQYLDVSAGSNHAAIIVQDERSRGRLYTWGLSSLGRLGQGNGEHVFEDSNYPSMVDELKCASIVESSCGQSHSACISSNGSLFLWGAGSSGQLGFGEMSDGQGYCCAIPTKLLIPSCKVTKVSCGACHTACIGRSGELYVWGGGDGGRLGLGRDRMATQYTPTLVDSLRHERARNVSCGTSTTLVLTVTDNVGTNGRRSVKRVKGGRLYVAGPKNVLGAPFPSFGEIVINHIGVIKHISAGYSHQSFVTESGELYCWGHNFHGCCGQEERIKFLSEPTKVDWLYEAPKNLALGKSCRLSTLFNDSEGLSANNAVDGNIGGNGIKALAHTFFEANPYFDIDLGSFVQISNVRLWNRTDEPDDCALHIDMFSKRLFPCFIMISQFPFPNLEGKEGLDACFNQSVATVRFAEDRRMSNWNVPTFTVGRYVRVQLEDTNFLHFAQIEVFGHEARSHGPITSCSAGKFVTAAVVGCMEDRKGVGAAYKRAICADWYNAEILRQFSSYSDEYRKEGNSFDHKAKCLLCVGNEKCDICSLKSKFRSELKGVISKDEPYRLGDLVTHLLSASEIEGSDGIEIGAEDNHGSEGVRSRNILPILLKMKHRRSLVRQKKSIPSGT